MSDLQSQSRTWGLSGMWFKAMWRMKSFLLSRSRIADRYRDIARFYDDLYEFRPNAWKELVGRNAEFINYVSCLVP